MANLPYRFQSGDKARAGEVNKNFEVCINAINQNITSIEGLSNSVQNLTNTKANKNGSASERFAVADPVNNKEAVNKDYLNSWTGSLSDIISGLIISKQSDDTIAVTAGQCIDSTNSQVIKLSTGTTKQYEGTLASETTYDVYITKNKTTSNIDISILSNGSTPDSSVYYYKLIGNFVTDGDGDIYTSYSYSITSAISSKLTPPDFTTGVSKSINTTYTADIDGWIVVYGTIGYGTSGGSWGSIQASIDDVTVWEFNASSSWGEWGGNHSVHQIMPVAKGQTYRGGVGGNTWSQGVTFYSCKGV